ncbi:MAG: hypothetical protein ACREK1_05465, partial [Longimicrobiales bacterium]
MSTGSAAAAATLLDIGAASLSFSVFADSVLEHYRGDFHNRVMYAGPGVAAATLFALVADAAERPVSRAAPVYGTAVAAGLVGTGFHVRNVLRRPGGLSWENLFHAAPVAAPLGLTFAGIFGLTAARVRRGRTDGPTARAVLALAALGLAGTAAEAGMLHFRGAFQDPFMYLPVTVPPAAAAGIAATLAVGDARAERVTRSLLTATAAIGVAGMGFHAWGIHRNMGGWHNWKQMLLQGPPLP